MSDEKTKKLESLKESIAHGLKTLPSVPRPDIYELRRPEMKVPPLIVEHVAKSILMLFGIEPFNWKTAQLVFQDDDHVSMICQTASKFKFEEISRENYEEFRKYVDGHQRAFDRDAMWQSCRSAVQLSQWTKKMVSLVRLHLEFFELGGTFPKQNDKSTLKDQQPPIQETIAAKLSEPEKTTSKEEVQQLLLDHISKYRALSKDQINEIQQMEVVTAGIILLSGGKLRQYAASVSELPKLLQDFDVQKIEAENGQNLVAHIKENQPKMQNLQSSSVRIYWDWLLNVSQIFQLQSSK